MYTTYVICNICYLAKYRPNLDKLLVVEDCLNGAQLHSQQLQACQRHAKTLKEQHRQNG